MYDTGQEQAIEWLWFLKDTGNVLTQVSGLFLPIGARLK